MIKMSRKIKIGIVGIILLTTIIPVAISANVKSNLVINPAQATNIQGSVCFKYDNFADTWVLNFEHPGQYQYIVSGYDPVFPSSMAGGGGIVGSQLLLTLDERWYGGSLFGDHNVVIDLTSNPLKGTDLLRWTDINGALLVNYPNGLTFTQITCPAPGAVPQINSPTTVKK